VNRKAARPFEHLLFNSFNRRTFKRMESLIEAAYKRWTGTEWWSDGYERLWKGKEQETAAADSEDLEQDPLVDQSSVVYLTADSTEELTELKEGETYIIGGIVDHNRYKVRGSSISSIWKLITEWVCRISVWTKLQKQASARLDFRLEHI
jgi:tRNA (guanine9-N1)-methyltransferase